MEFSAKVGNGPTKKYVNFDGDPDNRLDTGIVFRIRDYWEIRKVVLTDCAALAGIAIAILTSIHRQPTTGSGTDIATLVRRALTDVCTVPVLLVMVALCNRADHNIFILWFVLSFFLFSSPNLSRRRLDVCHTSTHGVALV